MRIHTRAHHMLQVNQISLNASFVRTQLQKVASRPLQRWSNTYRKLDSEAPASYGALCESRNYVLVYFPSRNTIGNLREPHVIRALWAWTKVNYAKNSYARTIRRIQHIGHERLRRHTFWCFTSTQSGRCEFPPSGLSNLDPGHKSRHIWGRLSNTG